MEKINQFDFYDIGRCLKGLLVLSDDIAPMTLVIPLMDARVRLNNLLSGKPITLGVSRATAQELSEHLQALLNECVLVEVPGQEKQFRWPDGSEQLIPGWRISQLNSQISKFEVLLKEELRDTSAYYIPKKGIYSVSALVDSADETFPLSLSDFMSAKVRTEWRSAGRCLAFNLYTASGFHVCRAVEAMLETYYQSCCDKPNETRKTWGDYIKALEASVGSRPAPTAKTISELQQMKDDYRNPVAHPRVVLEEADARMLFANGESLIIAMAQDLQRLLSLDHDSSQEHLLRRPANAVRLKEAVESLDKGSGT